MHPFYERKWLVNDPQIVDKHHPTMISQAYLMIKEGWSVRVRRTLLVGSSREESPSHNTLCVKGPRVGFSRPQYHWGIDDSRVAIQLYRTADWKIVKARHQIIENGHTWDVDVFYHDNEGLIIAECEVDDPYVEVLCPKWCGVEVSEDIRYCNEQLAMNPYKNWRAV